MNGKACFGRLVRALRPAWGRWLPRSGTVMAAATVLGIYGLAASPLFSVQSVVVAGLEGPAADRLAARLAWQRGRNLLEVEEGDVRQARTGEVRILDARLVRRLPSTLEVRVRAREPVAQVALGEGFWEVDRHGLVLGPAERPGSLPVITGAIAPGQVLASSQAGPPGVVAAATLVDELLPILGERLGEIHLDAAGEAWIYLNGGGAVRWGSLRAGHEDGGTGQPGRLQVLQALLERIPQGRPFEADVRDPERVVWRLR